MTLIVTRWHLSINYGWSGTRHWVPLSPEHFRPPPLGAGAVLGLGEGAAFIQKILAGCLEGSLSRGSEGLGGGCRFSEGTVGSRRARDSKA